VAGNIEAAAGCVRAAGDARARLVVFPEAFATGYDEAVFSAALPGADDPSWLAPLQQAVDDTGAVAILNTALDHGDRRAVADVVLAPGAPPLALYDKQHLYASERRHFVPGEHGATVRIDGVEIALSVCYDANFPEHAAAAAADGALVYVNSGAYFPGGAERRDLHYAARALDNGMYVVFAGLVGAPHDFIGGSAVFDPLGRRVASVATREGLAIADLDPAVVAEAREHQRMWADRRSALGPRRRAAF
jgi:predicted amidohydrolase